jgi:hypothetical protein
MIYAESGERLCCAGSGARRASLDSSTTACRSRDSSSFAVKHTDGVSEVGVVWR